MTVVLVLVLVLAVVVVYVNIPAECSYLFFSGLPAYKFLISRAFFFPFYLATTTSLCLCLSLAVKSTFLLASSSAPVLILNSNPNLSGASVNFS